MRQQFPILIQGGLMIPSSCRHAPHLSRTPAIQGEHQQQLARAIGDFTIRRADGCFSYQLAVVVDDAAQAITEPVRGVDLFEATPIHALLQRLLGLPVPQYHHHALIRDSEGKRLAKRDDARAITTYRAAGSSPEDIRALIGL